MNTMKEPEVVVITTGACSALFVNGNNVFTSVRASEPIEAGRSIAEALGVKVKQVSPPDGTPNLTWRELYSRLAKAPEQTSA
jgi:hypothetical protein